MQNTDRALELARAAIDTAVKTLVDAGASQDSDVVLSAAGRVLCYLQDRQRQIDAHLQRTTPRVLMVGPYNAYGFTEENMLEVAQALFAMTRGEAVILPAGVTVEHVGGGQ